MKNNAKKDAKQWTAGQSAAIRIKDKTLLVSAAAGSGKTATLTERIIRSITDGDGDISKMLIVTFTRAAAAELRTRIFTALSEALADDPSSKRLNEQLIKLGSANICTIDSFYFSVVRQNFSALGISATRRIADTAELELLKVRLAEEVIDDFYETETDFPSLAECFIRVKSINRLAEPILNIYEDVSAYPEGLDFLNRSADELNICAQSGDLMSTSYGDILRRELKKKFDHYYNIIDKALDHATENAELLGKRADVYASDRSAILRICSALDGGDYNTVRQAFYDYQPMKMYTPRGIDEDETSLFFKESRSDIKGEIDKLREKIFSSDTDTIRSQIQRTSYFLKMLYSLLCRFDEKYDEEKTRRNIMDFNDVRQLAYRLLVNKDGSPTDRALAYRDQFTHIYIDEYQDVDIVQDSIFSAISNNNRFMVGDIKQSIYGFRGADPQVFADYRKKLPLYDPGNPNDGEFDALTVFMSDNFRCDKNVIDFTNLVCGRLFTASADSIGYTKDDDLRFAKKQETAEGYTPEKVRLSVILASGEEENTQNTEGDEKKKKRKDPDSPEPEELEARYIASCIHKLIGKERLANGKLIQAGDIAILYRSGKMVSYLSQALAKWGIRCSEGGGDSYFENPDVLLVLSLLNVVDNPHRDIHLAGALCSPLYEFSLDELIAIRRSGDRAYSLYDALLSYGKEKDDALSEKCRRFDSELEKLRAGAVALPVDRFLRLLFESDPFISSGLLSDRDEYGDGGNLLRLYDYARTFESGSFRGLYNFIEFINSLIENGKMLEIAKKEPNESIVTLSTMHHSKGLEFPVCFICGTGSGKNMQQLYSSLLYEYPTGIAMKLPDNTGFARINTPMREAIAMSKYLTEIEEEMRILYVAMTRARERLYITATKRSTKQKLMEQAYVRVKYPSAYAIDECRTFLEWLLLPFADAEAPIECAELEFIMPQQIEDEAAQEETAVEDTALPQKDDALYRKLVEDMAFVYPHADLGRIPSKLSVSRLYPDILDPQDLSVDISRDNERTKVPDFFISGTTGKATAAERGTATHLFLQFCDFKRAEKHGASEELARLVNDRFIPENLASIVYKEELDAFLRSELRDKISGAKEIVRERRFNLLLPADAFTSDEATARALHGEHLAVQGVIDLILIDENGDIELYDYKTDRLTREELENYSLAKARMNSSHGLQLSYYVYAVEALFERKCKRVCVYSTHSAKLYDIERVPLKLDC